MRRICRVSSSWPSPQPSTPQLFDTTSRSSTPDSSSAAINTLGIPHNPKPPTAREDPGITSATASRALATTLSTTLTVDPQWVAGSAQRTASASRSIWSSLATVGSKYNSVKPASSNAFTASVSWETDRSALSAIIGAKSPVNR